MIKMVSLRVICYCPDAGAGDVPGLPDSGGRRVPSDLSTRAPSWVLELRAKQRDKVYLQQTKFLVNYFTKFLASMYHHLP